MVLRRGLTVGILAVFGLLACGPPAVLSQTSSASGVFARFIELDSQGAQLTSDGWREIAALFVNPGTPRLKRILVTDRGSQLRPAPQEGKIGMGRECIVFGQIELPQVRFSAVDGLPPGAKIREEGLFLVKIPSSSGAEEWRIEGPVPEPHLAVDAAIRYVTGVKASTKDAAIVRIADETLATLKRLR